LVYQIFEVVVMQEIKLKIGGTLLVEDWEYNNAFRECETKIKIFDSDGKYLTYWETETIEEIAYSDSVSPEKWLEIYRQELMDAESIHDLLELLGLDFCTVVKGKDDEAKRVMVEELTSSDAYSLDDVETLMNKTFDEIVSDYYDVINRIGEWTIINWGEIL